MPMTRRRRIIFLIIFAVPIVNLLILGTIYDIHYEFPIIGLLTFTLGAVYIYLQKVRGTATALRPRPTRIALRLYLAFALVALFNIMAEGWNWYDLLYLVFPTAVSALMFRSNHKSREIKSA
jgi:hypothetical protein